MFYLIIFFSLQIPQSAVEMPGDLTVGCLDLQFGAMDIIGDNNSFDSAVNESNKYGNISSSNIDGSSATPSSNMDLNAVSNASLDAYSPSKPNTQSSISSALSQSVSIICVYF